MKRWFPILFIGVLACGKYDAQTTSLVEPDTSQPTIAFVFQAASYLSAHFDVDEGILQSTTVYIGTQANIERSCQAKIEVSGCIYNDVILVSTDANECETIAHELTHRTSFLLYSDWDVDHHRLGTWSEEKGVFVYLEPFEICS